MAGAQGSSNTVSELALAIFVVALILILLIEVPTWIINFSISLNITLGIVPYRYDVPFGIGYCFNKVDFGKR